jgi:hypothetical protein
VNQAPTADPAVFWEDLLVAVESGNVVPIVGRDLLVVETPAGQKMFHHLLAEKLAEELRIPADTLPASYDPNQVVCAYKDQGFSMNPDDMSLRMARILRSFTPPVPEPLRLLAEIRPFSLFLSTTYDSLLAQAIKAVRERAPEVIAFPPTSRLTDFDETMVADGGAAVFHILGQASGAAPFALTEGQTLEQIHDFMASPRRPERLLDRLRESHLLIVGVSFPDWLARFLVRLARSKPLWDSRPVMEFIADSSAAGNGELGLFLNRFSPWRSHLYAGTSSVEFVRELNRRWRERSSGKESPAAADVAESAPEIARGVVFISYAKEDQVAAFRLADSFVNGGLDVWVDRSLKTGDVYRRIIEKSIRDSCAFVPVLSSNLRDDGARYVRREWQQACDRNKDFFASKWRFLFPVVVDGTPRSKLSEIGADVFGEHTMGVAPGGVPSDELIGELSRLQRQYRSKGRNG